ncbi:MAG: MazG nucleotide pyrophosphohydrolase domain-containing protein [Candidatus Nealsonbacteria bacterium]
MENIQGKVKKFVEEYNLKHRPEIATLDLVSEVGEIAKEILKASNYGKKEPEYKEDLKEEIGDAFYSLINLANHYNIDLEQVLEMALEKYKTRLEKRVN